MDNSKKSKIDFSPGYKIRDQQGIYFLTLQIVYWIDIFSRQCYKDIFIESLKYCQKNKGLKVHAYVIMTNHVHIILSTSTEEVELEDLKEKLKNAKTEHDKIYIENSIVQVESLNK